MLNSAKSHAKKKNRFWRLFYVGLTLTFPDTLCNVLLTELLEGVF